MFPQCRCMGGGGASQTVSSSDDEDAASIRKAASSLKQQQQRPRRQDPPPEIDAHSSLFGGGDLSSVSFQTRTTPTILLKHQQSVEENPNRVERRGDDDDDDDDDGSSLRGRGKSDPPSLFLQNDGKLHYQDGIPIVDEGLVSKSASVSSSRRENCSSNRGWGPAPSPPPPTKLGNEHLRAVSNRVEEYMGPLGLEDVPTPSDDRSRRLRSNNKNAAAHRNLAAPAGDAADEDQADDTQSLSSRELEIKSAAASSRRSRSSSCRLSKGTSSSSRRRRRRSGLGNEQDEERQEQASHQSSRVLRSGSHHVDEEYNNNNNNNSNHPSSSSSGNGKNIGNSGVFGSLRKAETMRSSHNQPRPPRKQESSASESSVDRVLLVNPDMSSLSSCSGYRSRSNRQARHHAQQTRTGTARGKTSKAFAPSVVAIDEAQRQSFHDDEMKPFSGEFLADGAGILEENGGGCDDDYPLRSLSTDDILAMRSNDHHSSSKHFANKKGTSRATLLKKSASGVRRTVSPTATYDSWDECRLRQKSSFNSRAAHSENAHKALPAGRLASFSSESLNQYKAACRNREVPTVASRAELFEEAAVQKSREFKEDRLSLLRGETFSRRPRGGTSSQASRAAYSEDDFPRRRRLRTKEDRMSSLPSHASDDQIVQKPSYGKSKQQSSAHKDPNWDEYRTKRRSKKDTSSVAPNDDYLTRRRHTEMPSVHSKAASDDYPTRLRSKESARADFLWDLKRSDEFSSVSSKSGLMHGMKPAQRSHEHPKYPRISFADALTDTESTDQSSVSSRNRDRDMLSAGTTPSRPSILRTKGQDKSKMPNYQSWHVAFADRLTDSEESSGLLFQHRRLAIEKHLRDKKNRNHLLNYQPWIDRRIGGENYDKRRSQLYNDPDADTNSIVTPSIGQWSLSPTPPFPTTNCSNVSVKRADGLVVVHAGSVCSSLPAEVTIASEEIEVQLPKVYSASSVASGVPVVEANSVTDVPVVEAGSVSTGTLQQSQLELTSSASILQCVGPPPENIQY